MAKSEKKKGMNKKVKIIILILVLLILENFIWGIQLGPILIQGFQIHKEYPADIKILGTKFSDNNTLTVAFSIGTKYPFGEESTLYEVMPLVEVYSDYNCEDFVGGTRKNESFQITFPQKIILGYQLFLEDKYNKLSVEISADGKYPPTYKGSSECVTVDLTGYDGLCSNEKYSFFLCASGTPRFPADCFWCCLSPVPFSALPFQFLPGFM